MDNENDSKVILIIADSDSEKIFDTLKEAIEYTLRTNIRTFALRNEFATWCFFGNKCIYATDPVMLKFGEVVIEVTKNY